MTAWAAPVDDATTPKKVAGPDLWVASRKRILNDKKTNRLARQMASAWPPLAELGATVAVDVAIAKMHRLWWWALDNCLDGDLSRFTDADVEDAVGWEGPRGAFIRALLEAELVDAEPRRIHNWRKYANRLIAQQVALVKRADRNRSIYSHPKLCASIRARDGEWCRFCGIRCNLPGKDKRSPRRLTYEVLDPRLESVYVESNVVVACGGCAELKGGRPLEHSDMPALLPPRNGAGSAPRLGPANDGKKPAETCRKSAVNLPSFALTGTGVKPAAFNNEPPSLELPVAGTTGVTANNLPQSAVNLPSPASPPATGGSRNGRVATPLAEGDVPEPLREAHRLLTTEHPDSFVPNLTIYEAIVRDFPDVDLTLEAARFSEGDPETFGPRTAHVFYNFLRSGRDRARRHHNGPGRARAATAVAGPRRSQFDRFEDTA